MQEFQSFDILNNFYRGVNSSIHEDGSYYLGVNTYLNNGEICTGRGIKEVGKIGRRGNVQGGFLYSYNGEQRILIGINGELFAYDLNDLDTSIKLWDYAKCVRNIYFCQVHNFVIVQDGVNKPLVLLNGSVVDDHNVPRGTVMAFVQGRLFVATDKGIEASDIYLPYKPYNFLKFSEIQYLAGGGALGLPANLGKIVALNKIQTPNSGSGEGTLLAFCERGICGFNVSAPRITWSDTDISRILVFNISTPSHLGTVPYNTDVVFTTRQGISSLKVASQSNSSLLKSFDFTNYCKSLIKLNKGNSADFSQIALFKNYILVSSIIKKRIIEELDNEEFYFDGVACFNTSPDIIEREIPLGESLLMDISYSKDNAEFNVKSSFNVLLDDGYILGKDENQDICLFKIFDMLENTTSVVEFNKLSLTKYALSDYQDVLNERKLKYIELDLTNIKSPLNILAFGKSSIEKKYNLIASKDVAYDGTYQGGMINGLRFSVPDNVKIFGNLLDIQLIIKGITSINRILVNGRVMSNDVVSSNNNSIKTLDKLNNYLYI